MEVRGIMTFKATHEFRGLELEHHSVDDYIDGLGSYYDASGTQYRLSSDVVTKLPEKPKPGEVWKYDGNHNGDRHLTRGVDAMGRLLTVTDHGIVWDPEEDSVENLVLYKKVLNADGTPADGV
jgi:hypothetical protein